MPGRENSPVIARSLPTTRLLTTFVLGALIVGGGVLCGYVVVQSGFSMGLLLLLEAVYLAAVLARPVVGVLGSIAVLYLLPFGVNPVPVGAFHPSFLDLSLSVTSLSWLLRLLRRSDQELVITPTIVAALLFLGLATASLLFGLAWTENERLRLFLKMVNSVLFALTVLNVLRSKESILSAARLLVLVAAAAAMAAVVLYRLPVSTSHELLVGLGWLGYPTDDRVIRYIADTTTLRAIGTAIDPNVLGGMLMLALPLALTGAFDRRTVMPRGVLFAAAGVIGLALLLTYSRSAWLGALAAVGLLGPMGYRRAWGLGAVGGLAVLLLPQGRAFVERFVSGVEFADRAAQMRLGEYQDALRVIADYPVFGVGFGFPEINIYIATSSIYLLLGQQTGLLGLGAFLLVIAVFFWEVMGRRMGETGPARNRPCRLAAAPQTMKNGTDEPLILSLSKGEGVARPALVVRQVHHERVSQPTPLQDNDEPVVGNGSLDGIKKGALAGVVGALITGPFDHYFMNLEFPHTVALLWLFMGLALAAARIDREQASELPDDA